MSFFKKLLGVSDHPTVSTAPKRLPTPEETKQAIAQLNVAYSSIDRAIKNPQPKAVLATGAKALQAARQLDPYAEFVKDGIRHTHDVLAAQLLYFEADLFQQEADASSLLIASTSNFKEHYRHAVKCYDAAREASKKAVQFQPNNTTYLNQLARLNMSDKKTARELVQRILALDPGNVDALTLQHEL